MDTLFKLLGAIVLVILMAMVFGLITGFLVMLLWNWLVPSIFHLREINFWEGWGLCVLTSFLFKTTVTSK